MQASRPMNEPALQYLLSVEEYLQLETVSPVRHEYLAGQIFAMTGGTRRHNRIAGRLYNAIDSHLGAGPCEAYFADVKVRFEINTDEYVYYPDVLVSCDSEESELYVQHPRLIIEVLSPSTENVDRREKALLYRAIPSLEEYVMVAQDKPQVIMQRRSEQWRQVVYSAPDAVVEFRSIGFSIPLVKIYERLATAGDPDTGP
jgi:Uma2 family endonuclease